MAVQFWYKTGKPQKGKFLTITNGYHGDTFGAMSVCDPVNGMHGMFQNVLAQQLFVDSPSSCPGGEKESACKMRKMLQQKSNDIAAVIMEPIIQGAGGMKVHSPWYLREIRNLCYEFDVLFIADEIATGFGRTGELFACNHADISPDILCLGKALTGGYMTMGATLTTPRICEGISKDNGVFMHGPTFMGNPLASAVALASVRLLLDSPWKERVRKTEKQLKKGLTSLMETSNIVKDVRILGAIGVCELKEPVSDMTKVQDDLISNGVWLRPFGKLLYTMPPFNAPIGKEEVNVITNAVLEAVKHEQNRRQ
uniref:7,8-diamino-pelargonic acid aminotransferase n=1 Tax=Aplanochytrium stocchinoi TaxID=215587 RepID=A0A7S3PKH1_9STRA